jgi:H+-translocating NAD(P) transhydrogenase subunit alpha
VIGTIAIAFGTINIVGGFLVTDRMLGMFSRKPKPAVPPGGEPKAIGDGAASPTPGRGGAEEG